MSAQLEADTTMEAGPSSSSYPTPPTFAFDAAPRHIASILNKDLESEVRTNFCRSARWCPDGSSVLTTSEDRVLRVFGTPIDAEPHATPPYRSFAQPDAIHATTWYSTASSGHPETFCFAASIRDTPVRLIDASDGRIRATYPIVDHRERFVAPYAMAFSPDASRLYCGHENAIEVLDIATPGPGGSERIKTAPTKRDRAGQKGIISALAFSTDYSGLYAGGSFAGSVSLYQEDHDGSVGHLDGVVGGGVTQVQFHPLSPNHLFVASRRSDVMQVYDLRNPSECLRTLPRKGDTNQRLTFDIDPWGRYLTAGDQDGLVTVWDAGSAIRDSVPSPLITERLCNDVVGSAQLHPFKPYLMTVDGSRHDHSAVAQGDSESDSSDDSDSISESSLASDISDAANGDTTAAGQKDDFVASEDGLRIWSFA